MPLNPPSHTRTHTHLTDSYLPASIHDVRHVCVCRYDYDLDDWRAGSYISNRDFSVLDADDGAGEECAGAWL